MPQWKARLELGDVYQSGRGAWDDSNIHELGTEIARRIRAQLARLMDFALEDIAEAFECITGFDEVTPIREFDQWMAELYDWADSNQVWINTTTPNENA